jgi:hypothetical protein
MRNLLAAALLAAVTFSGVAHGQDQSRLAKRFVAGDTETRAGIAHDLFGAGSRDRSFYNALSETVEDQIDTLVKNDERISEIGWSIKTLGGSGDLSYLPLIERAVNNPIRDISSDGIEAKQILLASAKNGRPYLTEDKIRLISDGEAKTCEFLKQASCETRHDAEDCLSDHRADALEAGADSIQIINSTDARGLFGLSTVTANYYECAGSL